MRFLSKEHTVKDVNENVLGTIQRVDLGYSRTSPEAAMELVADIASISYGNQEAKNPQQLFERLVRVGHLSCLEFVPVETEIFHYDKNYDLVSSTAPQPFGSLRRIVDEQGEDWKTNLEWSNIVADRINQSHYAFKVTCTKDIAVQWMRHRNASYLEMSRRYVKDSKVPFTFSHLVPISVADYGLCKYGDQLTFAKLPPEQARKVIPFGFMTTFYVSGNLETYWNNYLRLRTDAHTQSDHKAFADKISNFITGSNSND